MATIPKPITAVKGKIFDVRIIQSMDVIKFIKSLGTSKYMYKLMEKGMAKALLICQAQSQKNITSMKAVLSGWMRNKFEKAMVRPNPDILEGYLANTSWYAYMVHEGVGPHAQPPDPKWINPKGLTPDDIIELQKKRLAIKKTRIKQDRPFMARAFEEKKEEMIREISDGATKGIQKVFAITQGRKERAAKRRLAMQR